MGQELQVTSLDMLKGYSQGSAVELPAFGDGQPFVAKLKRPSMLALVKSGKIPNSLLTTANELFAGDKGGMADTDDASAMSNLFEVMDILCEACFVEPTYKQLKEVGVELTDDQYMFVFSYTQTGVRALDSFRKERESDTHYIYEPDVR